MHRDRVERSDRVCFRWQCPSKQTGSDVAEKTANLRGLKCPLPALKTRKLLAGLPAGEILIIECTDPLTAVDIPNLLRETGDTLEDSTREANVMTFRIR